MAPRTTESESEFVVVEKEDEDYEVVEINENEQVEQVMELNENSEKDENLNEISEEMITEKLAEKSNENYISEVKTKIIKINENEQTNKIENEPLMVEMDKNSKEILTEKLTDSKISEKDSGEIISNEGIADKLKGYNSDKNSIAEIETKMIDIQCKNEVNKNAQNNTTEPEDKPEIQENELNEVRDM